MTATRDLERELQEWDGWPSAWKPKPGDTLVGRIRRYSTGPSAYGEVRTCIIETDAGEKVSVWISSTVLLSLFQREKPKVGERVGIRYVGKHATKGYRVYTLIVDRPQAEQEFTPLGGESGDDPDPTGSAYAAAAGLRADPFDFGGDQ